MTEFLHHNNGFLSSIINYAFATSKKDFVRIMIKIPVHYVKNAIINVEHAA
jgi:hypothetical protein